MLKALIGMVSVMLVSCSQPTIVSKVETKEVYIPVRCQVEMPIKPAFKKSLEGVKELMEYYVTVERYLKLCINGN